MDLTWLWFPLLAGVCVFLGYVNASIIVMAYAAVAAVPVFLVARAIAGEVQLHRLCDKPDPVKRPRPTALPAPAPRALPPVPPLASGRFVVDVPVEDAGGAR